MEFVPDFLWPRVKLIVLDDVAETLFAIQIHLARDQLGQPVVEPIKESVTKNVFTTVGILIVYP